MSKVFLELIKKVRNITGVSISKCKDALLATDGNVDEAVYNLRKNNKIFVREKPLSKLNSGCVFIACEDSRTSIAMVEVCCETDFVSSNILFKDYVRDLASCVLQNKIKDLDLVKNSSNIEIIKVFVDDLFFLKNKFGENIIIKNIFYSDNMSGFFGYYIHIVSNVSKIGVVVSANIFINEVLDNVAMQIAATNPKYIKYTDIPEDILVKERELFKTKINSNCKNYNDILDKAVFNSLKDFVLLEQNFLLNPGITVGQYLSGNNIFINEYIRFELGL